MFDGIKGTVTVEKAISLTFGQQAAVKQLVEECRKRDRDCLSYPMEPDVSGCHYLLWGRGHGDANGDTYMDGHGKIRSQGRQLLSVLAFVPYDGGTAECIAFTHPMHRKNGYFSRLLDWVVKEHGDSDILFPVSGQGQDTAAALDALGAVLDSREYLMQRELAPHPAAEGGQSEAGSVSVEEGQSEAWGVSAEEGQSEKGWLARREGLPENQGQDGNASAVLDFYPAGGLSCAVGTLQAALVSEHCVCVHHVEIDAAFRGKGFGGRMMRLLLEELARRGTRRVVLQVSADNGPAVRMYKKAGFRITETLSYYLY